MKIKVSLTDVTSKCIRCGFCLESCPTYVMTGEETESPRGRIYLVRSAEEGQIKWEDVRLHMNRCLGCLACATACPSGVDYATIFEGARGILERKKSPLVKRLLLASLTKRKLIKAQLKLSKLSPGTRVPKMLSKMVSGRLPEADKPIPQKADLPPLEWADQRSIQGEVYFLRGCVMDVLFERVHECTIRLLSRIGYRARTVDVECCGSLHLHNGYEAEAQHRALRTIRRFREAGVPVIVDSAGCGSTMKHYGHTLETDTAKEFSRRVFDASEFLLANGLNDLLASSPGIHEVVTYHDACHLAHGQGIRGQPRELIRSIPGISLFELSEADMCCGSAGIYNLTQPAMARALLERKYENIRATGASIVVTGNPGCHAWIAQAAREHGDNIRVLHTMELLEAAFIGLERLEQ